MILVLFLLPSCLMLFDRWIVKPDYAQKKHAKMNSIRSKKLILPVLSELHQQRLRLIAQIRENRRARHREMRKKLTHLLSSLRGKSQNTDDKQSQSDNKEDKHDDES